MYEVVSLRVLARSSVLLKAILILQQVVLKAEVGGSMLIEESQGRYEKVEKKKTKKKVRNNTTNCRHKELSGECVDL